jgi:hypothetical protein
MRDRRLVLLCLSALSVSTCFLCQAQTTITSVAGYLSSNDSYQHAIVATDDGRIHETYFDPGINHDEIGCFGQILGQSSFYSSDDAMQHVTVARADGTIRDLAFSAGAGQKLSAPIGTVPDLISLTAFYAADDKSRIVLTGSSDGSIREIWYGAGTPIHGGEVITKIAGLTHIAGFFTPDDGMRHVIVSTSTGDVIEVYYSSASGLHITQPALVNFHGIVSIAAFYTPDDKMRHVIVATSDGAIQEVFYGGTVKPTVSHPALASFPDVASLAGYYTPADGNRHVIVGRKSGEVREIFYNSTTGKGNDQLWQATAPVPTIADISPDAANVKFVPGTNASGLTLQLGGTAFTLYAVTLDGGIARSINGGAWIRLVDSPRYATSIAVDPKDNTHVVVGERAGDLSGIPNGGGGVWESTDAGATWKELPTSPSCTPQEVPAVAFSPASSILIGTDCGVGWRKAGSTSPFSFAAGTSTVNPTTGLSNPITALAVSETKVWARNQQTLFVSTLDGQTFSTKSIPTQYTFPRSGDVNSLAAFDGAAYMTCCQVSQPGCDILNTAGNWNQMLVYNAATDQFALQPSLQFTANPATPQLGCDGTGLGGSRFVRAFRTTGANGAVTNRLFYSGAQEVHEAVSLNSSFQATQWARTLGSTECTAAVCNPQDQVHGDIWDILITADGSKEWVSNDGGVYTRSNANSSWTAWTLEDSGLHTHHIHTVTVVRSSPSGRGNLAYATSDDSSWWWNGAAGWGTDAVTGDSNWTVGDSGNASCAVMALHLPTAELTGLGSKLQSGKIYQPITISNDNSRDGPESFNVVQSLWGDVRQPYSLDAVMLANLPLQWRDQPQNCPNNPMDCFHNVQGIFGETPAIGPQNPLLLRKSDFAANPDINYSPTKGVGWVVEENNLPAGITRFWVSGGHTKPTYYVLSVDPSTGSEHLNTTTGSVTSPDLTVWHELNVQGNVFAARPWLDSGMLDGSPAYGPVFVNPYNPSELYVLTNTGVRNSETGGESFQTDSVLTNLITANGKYPLTGRFSGGNDTGVRMASRAVVLGSLSDMDFRRDDPRLAVAASPFAGAFFRDKTGKWHDLTSLLPRPLVSVSSVRIDCDAIYVGTEGGGIYRITGYEGIQ